MQSGIRITLIHRRYLTALFCALLLITGGCVKKAKARDRTLLLENTVNSYSQAIRWNEWRIAAKHIRLRPELTETLSPQELAKGLVLPEGIRVSNYQMHGINADNELTSAGVVATISYYREDSVSVRQLQYTQDWWYDPEARTWFMSGRLPKFCTRERQRNNEC